MGALYLGKLGFYALRMRRFLPALIVLSALLFSAVSPAQASAKAEVKKHSSCGQLRKVWSKGVATSLAKARLQAVRPAVSATGYSKNRHLDTDRDGTACEVKKTVVQAQPVMTFPGATSTTTTTTTAPPTTTTTTIPVVCPSSVNVKMEIQNASNGSYRYVTAGRLWTYVTRNVDGIVLNNSGVRVKVLNFSLSGNLLSDNVVYDSQTIPVLNNVTLEPGDQYGWTKTYEALGYSGGVRPNVSVNETLNTLSFISLDSRCP